MFDLLFFTFFANFRFQSIILGKKVEQETWRVTYRKKVDKIDK